ncbi:uncharacterized protein [Palaemon carinicauda]|uniref:uncharacterized protein n=1 Tax=Palaemon carinicauda TaxID=392227 RepID=UPI0035B5CE38
METPKTEPAVTPQSLITEDHVRKALHADKGTDALLKSWKVVDFTKRGDNYACVVTSVQVKYAKCEGVESEVSYVVKLNACRTVDSVADMSSLIFAKEGRFYSEIVPALNEELISAGQEPLCVPKCFFVSLENGKEQLYLEDLRARGFFMFDRRKGMDKDHTTLVLNELARLHSASYLLLRKFKEGESLSTKFEFLSHEFFSDEFMPMFESFLKGCIHTGMMMLEKVGGYESSVEWLKGLQGEVLEFCTTGLLSEKYTSICHGDCWNNNVMFRYNDEGQPVEPMLVDLQACREASFATDLNYFIYTSLTGDVRVPNIEDFMNTYYSSYKDVLKGADVPMYFSKEELVNEFRDKNKLGLIFAMSIIPALLVEPEEVSETRVDDLEKLMQDFRKVALNKLKTNPLCKPRFLAIFDEFLQSGLIS